MESRRESSEAEDKWDPVTSKESIAKLKRDAMKSGRASAFKRSLSRKPTPPLGWGPTSPSEKSLSTRSEGDEEAAAAAAEPAAPDEKVSTSAAKFDARCRRLFPLLFVMAVVLIVIPAVSSALSDSYGSAAELGMM